MSKYPFFNFQLSHTWFNLFPSSFLHKNLKLWFRDQKMWNPINIYLDLIRSRNLAINPTTMVGFAKKIKVLYLMFPTLFKFHPLEPYPVRSFSSPIEDKNYRSIKLDYFICAKLCVDYLFRRSRYHLFLKFHQFQLPFRPF